MDRSEGKSPAAQGGAGFARDGGKPRVVNRRSMTTSTTCETGALPSASWGPFRHVQEVINMKVRPSVKPMCEKCKIIKRKGKVMVICENPKHKQRQG